MTQEEELFQQLLQIVQKYYPYDDPSKPQTWEVQERQAIVHQNDMSIQMWQEFAGNFIKYDERAIFMDQISSALNIYPLVNQYLTIKSHGLQLKKIETIQVEQYYQGETILKAFQTKSKQRITQHLKNSSNIQEYLVKQISFIVDILQRRTKLNDYFEYLVLQSRKIQHFAQKFGTMKFVDFIIILQRFTYPSDIISFLIAQQNAPSPVQFTALDQDVNYANNLVNLLKFKKHHLVLNIWSPNSMKYVRERIQNEQEVLFSKALQIDKIYFAGSHFGEVINLYKLNVQQKEMVLIDYIEKEKYYEDQKNDLIINLFTIAQIVIFHLDQRDVQKPQQGQPQSDQLLFLQKHLQKQGIYQDKIIRFFCQQISKQTLMKDIRAAIQPFYEKVSTSEINRYQADSKENFKSFHDIFKSLDQDSKFKMFSVTNLSSNLKRHDNYQEIMDFLSKKTEQNKKIYYLPKICKQKELNKVRTQINNLSISEIRTKLQQQEGHKKTTLQILQESNEQYMQTLSLLSKRQEQLKKQLLEVKLSEFVKSCLKYIQQTDGIQIQEFIDGLIQKTNQILNKELSQLNENFPERDKRKQEYKVQKDLIMSQRISIDEIIYQYNVFNELTIDRKKKPPSSYQQLDINRYYQKCLNTQNSFNIVDGDTSNFGNKSLQRFFLQIKRKKEEESKEIFVISFIGPKSSGKSSLSNYLFHFNIHMREDEYAKGIYVGQCQVSKKTIVVLDTAGIMQIDLAKEHYQFSSEQLGQIFATFDHQVASLLLKVSDLVVFAGFTEQKKDHLIPQQLQLVVGVCYKVLNAIQVNNYSDQKKIVPKRIMFALSKKSEASQNIDKQQAIKLMIKHLQPILLLQDPNGEKDPRKLFQKYMRLQAQDIFQIPNLYQNIKHILKVNETYGLQILGFRSKILKHLERIKNHRVNAQQMIGFYRKAQANWDVIMVTGSNILKAKSLTESYERQFIFQLYRSLYPKIYQQIIKNMNVILPETQFKPLTFTSQQVQKQLEKQQQQSTFNSWTIFSTKLDKYLTDIYKSPEKDIPSKYENIINQSAQIFQMQAQKTIQDLTNYQDLYLTSISKLFDVVFYRRIKEYYRSFESIFATGVQSFTITKIFNIILAIKIEYRYNQEERQRIFDQQTNKILQSKYFMPIKREVVSSNLNSLFGTILSTENVFIHEIQIRSINDCLNFDKQINSNYIDNLNQFIYFENYQEVQQKYKAQFARLIEDKIKEFNQYIKKIFNDKVIGSDIRIDFQHIKNHIIDKQTGELSLSILQVSKRIYAQIALLDQSRRYIYFQQNLEKEEQELNQKKEQIQAALAQIQQQGQPKKKLTQDLEEIQRQIVYLQNVRETTNNLASQRIALTKINFVILLLAKMFNNLSQMIYDQQLAQLNQLKATFENDVNNSRQQAIKYFKQTQQELRYSIDKDYQQCEGKWQSSFEVKFTQIYKKYVLDSTSNLNESKKQLKDRIEGDTIKSQKINDEKLDKEEKKKIYIQCYKYVINPQRYLIEAFYGQLTASSQIASMANDAYIGINEQISNILNWQFKQQQESKKVEQGLLFLENNNLLRMKTFFQSQQKDRAIITIEELINQFKKKVEANAQKTEKNIKATANNDKVINHIRSEVLRIKDTFIGCTQGCPFCGAMCMNVMKHGMQHYAGHNDLAFGGCRDNLNYIVLRECGNKLKSEYWSYGYRTYKSHHAFLQKRHKYWAAQFPTNSNIQQAQSTSKQTIRVWANIQEETIKVFKKRHQYKFGLQQSRLQSIILERGKGFAVNANDVKANKLENYWVSIVGL